jgi:hypothetical protein
VREVELSYVRYQSARANADGLYVGIFGLVNVLGRHGMLTSDEEATRRRWNAWYDSAYPNPTADGSQAYTRSGAVAWFKRGARPDLLEPVPDYLRILDAHHIAWEVVETDDPGDVVYEDEAQVVAVPRVSG